MTPGSVRVAVGVAVRIAVAVAGVIIVTACQDPRSPATPVTIVLAEAAAPRYSLQPAADPDEWVVIFADAHHLTLRYARGRIAAHRAAVTTLATIDRIDVPPGVNPDLGEHAYVTHDGVEHLFYVDQELADKRVTKWIYREAAPPAAGAEATWMVDLVPRAPLPMAALPGSAQAPDAGLTLFGVLREQQRLVTYTLRAETVSGPRATALNGITAPAASPYACDERSGLLLEHDAEALLIEGPEQIRRVELEAGGPIGIGCHSGVMMAAYTRRDPGAGATSAGAALDALEIVAVDLHNGQETKVTLAREVGALAVFPSGYAAPTAGGGTGAGEAETGRPVLTVLFTERALDPDGEPEYRLSLVEPDGDGYRKRVLVRGAYPVQDFRALRAGRDLIVAFRRVRELRVLHARLAASPVPELVQRQLGGS